jgi:flavodoxin
MKNRGYILILGSVLFFFLCCEARAAGNSAGTPAETNRTNTAQRSASDSPAGNAKRPLIAYFSRVGNTAYDNPDRIDASSAASFNMVNGILKGNAQLLAEMIQENTGGDLFPIVTEIKYAEGRNEVEGYAREEQRSNERPALTSHVQDMEGYDTVFIVYPNWWFDMPMAVYSFLEEYDFSGKTVIPLATSASSGFSGSQNTLKEMLYGSVLLNGLAVRAVNAADAKNNVRKWLREIGVIE